MLKRQKKSQQRHMHYVITCGNAQCLMTFPLCGASGLPCFTICPFCQVPNKLGGDGNA